MVKHYVFPQKSRTRQGCPLTTLIQYSTGIHSLLNKVSKGNKRYTDQKGGNKTVHI